ncbi:hypothetical protein RAA17_20185 [Komagataeibacter rhaeticus]|nr:hypothetical protein [Komagataeibacter rhaeticus]
MQALDIFHMDTGGCTGCGLELRAVSRCAGCRQCRHPLRVHTTPGGAAAADRQPERGNGPGGGTGLAGHARPRLLAIVGDCAVDGGVFTPVTPCWAAWAGGRRPACRCRAARPHRP